ncbi:annexin A2-like isoform X2 [Syngnathus scovelli]|uniref:annexin A2-like isoform X2 n=1 Tax=Syngnathus scovelli TaxID=161590 RepID=UPI0021106C2F|nr:annexin A2-like isoform X2 [Syngnathus scovelli]
MTRSGLELSNGTRLAQRGGGARPAPAQPSPAQPGLRSGVGVTACGAFKEQELISPASVCVLRAGVKVRGIAMALVSEFLGQLTLSYGEEAEPTFPTVVAYRDFDPISDAARLDAALRTKGVDKQSIIDILTRRSYEQRRDIAFEYERLAKKDLQTALKGALSGSLEALMLGLMKSPAQYDALELKAAMKGLGTDEETLIEIVCSRNERELSDIQKVYREVFKKELEKDIAGDTSGDVAKLLLALVQTKRERASNVVDYQKIDDDAKSLYDAGIKRKGTDVAVWISILTQRSASHLQRVFERYKSYSPYDMKESIRKEVKGDLEKSLLALGQRRQGESFDSHPGVSMPSGLDEDQKPVQEATRPLALPRHQRAYQR